MLAQEQVQELTRLIRAFVQPTYDAHSSHARDIRSSPAALRFYRDAADGAAIRVMSSTVSRLRDLKLLAWIGFDTTFDGDRCSGLALTDATVARDDSLATHAWNLTVELCRGRVASAVWHCAKYPGKLALLTSDDDTTVDRCLRELLADWLAFHASVAAAGQNEFCAMSSMSSCFQQTLVKEVTTLLLDPWTVSNTDRLTKARNIVTTMFSGWGQTKVVEDTVCKLRDS